MTIYDVIVVGGGHAGIEACFVSSRMGFNTLLITHNIAFIGNLSCNPSIGGVGKSHLVSELSTFGALMPLAAIFSCTHYKILNNSKGNSVQSIRYQVDREMYACFIKNSLFSQKNLEIYDDIVENVFSKNIYIKGVQTKKGNIFYCLSIVVTVGTFINTSFFPFKDFKNVKKENINFQLALSLENFGLLRGRFKTGTPPRLFKNTINFQNLLYQPCDSNFIRQFSSSCTVRTCLTKSNCFVTYTNKETHAVIFENLKDSYFFNSFDKPLGPRYCPSIEDKIVKFPDKLEHQIFLESESNFSNYIYPSGLSTSLPLVVQKKFLRTIKGFENVEIKQPGYTIEYDYFDPRGLTRFLEVKNCNGMFLAGQLNGTTGYEEAAAQGFVAGVNAALSSKRKKLWIPERSISYIGVLIDDLVTKGVSEPYRMFTSNVENRLNLFEETVCFYFFQDSFLFGLVNFSFYKKCFLIKKFITLSLERLNFLSILPKSFFLKKIFLFCNDNILINRNFTTLYFYIKNINLPINIFFFLFKFTLFNFFVLKFCELEIKYFRNKFYFEKLHFKLFRYKKINLLFINDYIKVPGLAIEVREKLNYIKPYNFEQAAKISGVTPISLFLILLFCKKCNAIK